MRTFGGRMGEGNMIVLAIILVGLVIAVILAYFHSKHYWKMVQSYRWRQLQPQIEIIDNIYSRTSGEGGKIGLFEKGSVKKQLYECEEAFDNFLDFCKSKDLELPDECQQIREEIDSSTEVLDPQKALHKKLEQEKKKYDETYEMVDSAGNRLLEERKKNIELIDRAGKIVNSIASHPKSFDDNIGKSVIEKKNFNGSEEYQKQIEMDLKKTGGGVAAGIAAGAGVAGLAPTAAMWIATTFGTASTGTAISALSGAVAQNAALAWLGGGTLAAGGGGIAAGQAFLALAGPVGWGIAGTSILASVLITLNKKNNTIEQEKQEISQIQKCTEALEELHAKIDSLYSETCTLRMKLEAQIQKCEALCGSDYTSLSDEEQRCLGALVNNVLALSTLLNKTVSK